MTNCSLLTFEKLQFFKSYEIKAGFSIDGMREQQHSSRIPSDDKIDSFQVVKQALDWSKQIGYKVYSLSATYCEPYFYDNALFVIDLCRKYGIEEFDLDYDILALTDESIDLVASQLIECYRIAKSFGLSVFGYWLIPYINALNVGRPYKNYCDNATGTNICVSASGNSKICGYDPKEYGKFCDFSTVFDDSDYKEKIYYYTVNREHCMNCDLFLMCGGQCIFQDPFDRNFQRNCAFLQKIMSNLI